MVCTYLTCRNVQWQMEFIVDIQYIELLIKVVCQPEQVLLIQMK